MVDVGRLGGISGPHAHECAYGRADQFVGYAGLRRCAPQIHHDLEVITGAPHHLSMVGDRVRGVPEAVEGDAERNRSTHNLGCELELRHYAEVGSRTPQTPVKVGILVVVSGHHASVGQHYSRRQEMVAGKAILPAQPTHTAPQRQPRDTGFGHHARGCSKAERRCSAVHIAQYAAAPDAHKACVRVDGYPPDWTEIDHGPVVDHGMAGDAMPAALDCQRNGVVTGECNRRGDIRFGGAPNHYRRVAIDHVVPNSTGSLIVGVLRVHRIADQPSVQRGDLSVRKVLSGSELGVVNRITSRYRQRLGKHDPDSRWVSADRRAE